MYLLTQNQSLDIFWELQKSQQFFHLSYLLTQLTVDFTKGGFGTGGGFYPPEPIIQSNSNPNPISTENPCVTNSTYYFQCTNRRYECIPRSLICDGEFDCTDGSDEFTCRQRRGTEY